MWVMISRHTCHLVECPNFWCWHIHINNFINSIKHSLCAWYVFRIVVPSSSVLSALTCRSIFHVFGIFMTSQEFRKFAVFILPKTIQVRRNRKYISCVRLAQKCYWIYFTSCRISSDRSMKALNIDIFLFQWIYFVDILRLFHFIANLLIFVYFRFL